MTYQTLLVERRHEHLLLVTLNRPQAMNALNTQMGRDTLDLWTRLTAEPGEVRCVVLTGAGERAFCAGGDLKERNGMTDAAWNAQHEIFERAYLALLELPLPAIAAVNGAAFGGGLEMALCCDFIYAARTARLALPETTLALIPGVGGTQNLARAAGERRAKELILTGRAFDAQQGYEWGVVNRVCDNVVEEAFATARTIAANGPLAVRQAKKAIHYGLQMDVATGFRFAIEAYNQLVGTDDRNEGVRAFNEKRKPRFQGK
ncbi:MAG TPA: enoyl-CoA hydratase-related protein [Burkholderiales bacterium]|nr:enoyl-CoA hydratase-related protein [Burkholderiales bacterium]